jgi:hypothetical protein
MKKISFVQQYKGSLIILIAFLAVLAAAVYIYDKNFSPPEIVQTNEEDRIATLNRLQAGAEYEKERMAELKVLSQTAASSKISMQERLKVLESLSGTNKK